MKQQIITSIRQILADRGLFGILVLFLVACLSLLVYLGVNLQPSDLQVVVHYTSYGSTNFYRDKWYYLLGFAVFIVILAVSHITLTVKILHEKGRDLAIAFAWLGVILAFITSITVYQVLRIAALT
jgi:uncharacterized membrane protein YhaH (DUF805 family)